MSRYRNPLCEEMEQYLELLNKTGHYTKTIASLFRELDRYIPDNTEKGHCLSKEVIFEWDKNLSCSPVTRKQKYTELRGFARFLQTEGIICYIPETPRKPSSTYVPYIFDENEWNRIIMEADKLADSLKQTGTDMPIVFPMLIRILYVCGLRVSEALALQVKDVDFTRNQKLSGLSAFAKYAVNREPIMAAGFYSAVNGIPKKKADKTIPVYFTKEEIGILLHIPSRSRRVDIRNRTLLSVLYATGARAQELCDIQVRDIHFGDKTSIKLVGKGNKARKVIIPTQCAALLRDYLSSENKLTDLDSHVFSSQTNEHMTISCVEEIVKKYVRVAKQENPSLFREKNYSPHSFRHSIAVHMLEAGIPLPVIKNFLGHSSIEVTMIYATVSDELKNKYLKENGIVTTLITEEKNDESKHSYPGLDFLNKI